MDDQISPSIHPQALLLSMLTPWHFFLLQCNPSEHSSSNQRPRSRYSDRCVTRTANPQQKQKCNALVRKNVRHLERDIQNLRQLEQKTKNFILQASRRSQRNPSQAKQAARETRTFARELVRIRKQNARLTTSKAQLQSVQMQVNEAFAVRKIEGSIKTSVGIMRDVNTLVRLPELTGTMRELSQELVKAGIIEDMVSDMLPDDAVEEEEEAEAEVDKVLSEVLKDKLPPSAQRTEEELPPAPVAEEEDNQEEILARLEALKS
jgi:charged multivesicular body protein 3